MPHAPFVPLRVQSAYSMLESACLPKDIAKACRKAGFAAVALGDRNNLFGAMEFSEACVEAGVQPIVGALVAVERPGARTVMSKPVTDWLVLLAQDAQGYANLIALVSEAHLGGTGADEVRLTLDSIAARSAGLLCLTGGAEGALARLIAEGQDATAYADALVAAFPQRLYVEVSRTGDAIENKSERVLIDMAHARDLPLVATNPVRFLTADVHAAHDAMLCIADSAYVDAETRRRSNPEHWLKSAAEMALRFADLPEALANTLVVAQRCAFAAPARKPILPSLAAGDAEAERASLAADALAGLQARLDAAAVEDREPYIERLNFEVQVIQDMGFSAYFLIVADFIVWAKTQGIPVGPGRGSGAGSVVAWALTITDLDPLVHGLLFERFLNPDRVSMPDFDIDFCETRRDEVIRYVQTRYGRDRVAQIITFGRLKARAVIKDVGRVLQMPYGQIDRLAKQVPSHPTDPWTLARTLGIGADDKGKKYEGIPDLITERRRDPKVERLFDIALKLEGLPRHASTHAAGVVIGDRPLAELVPMYRDPRSDMPVTQFDMKYVEKAGLVKFDFLGLKTLTTLTTAVKLIAQRGIAVDLASLPFDDPKSYEMLARGEVVGVFQVESAGMRKALVEMKADRIEDLIALVALYRPGPMDNIPSYCRRKLGQEDPTYLHPKLEPILAETHGIIVYQEQVMQVAQALSGYSLGEADLLRRAMGKKIKAEMDAQADRFVRGAVEGGMKKDVAKEIFDLLAKFADYGFNKSHAAAYAVVAFQTAYLKANFPVEFLAASMTLDIGNTDKLSEFRRDCERMGIKVERPAINRSGVEFDVADGKIFYALGAIKGVGRAAVESIVAARLAGGGFRELADFARRIDTRLVNRRTIEALIAAGALDELEPERARAMAAIDGMLALSNRTREAAAGGQSELFGGGAVTEAFRIPPVEPWAAAERLKREHDAVGFFLSGHPLDDYEHVLKRLRVQRYADFAQTVRANGTSVAKVAASVIDKSERRTRSGSKMGIVNLSDPSGQFEAILFSEGLQRYRDLLEPGKALVLRLSAVLDGDDVRPRIEDVEVLDDLASRQKQDLLVYLRDDKALASIAERVRPRSDGIKAEGKIALVMILNDGAQEVEIELPGRYPVNQQIANAVRAAPGVVSVELR